MTTCFTGLAWLLLFSDSDTNLGVAAGDYQVLISTQKTSLTSQQYKGCVT